MRVMIALLLTGGVLLGGCGKKDEAAPAPAAAAVVDPNSTGVAECDAYLSKMEKCNASAPAEAKATMARSMTAMREQMKSANTSPGGKEKNKADCLEHSALLAKTCP